MKQSSRGPKPSSNPVPPQVRAALHLLLEGWDRALQSRRDVWEFAVKVTDLRAAGLATSDLRCFVTMGYVQHAVEKTKPESKRRVLGRPGELLDHDRTCFVLTEVGARAARLLEPEAVSDAAQVPSYDRDRRGLWLGSRLVKRFAQPAPDQHTILSAFQELGWPSRIDDPLPPNYRGQDTKLRLGDVIKRLNRHQQHRVIRFRGDGRGKGILWECVGRQ